MRDEPSRVAVLRVPSSTEKDVRQHIRLAVLEEIKKRHMDEKGLADVLGLLPSGSRGLLEREVWSLETGFRVADALGIRLKLVER